MPQSKTREERVKELTEGLKSMTLDEIKEAFRSKEVRISRSLASFEVSYIYIS